MVRIKSDERLPFGERLKNARMERGMTQKELAELIGISPNVLSKYENGKLIPSGDVLIRLSTVLGESINMMMCGFEDPNRTREPEPLIKDK